MAILTVENVEKVYTTRFGGNQVQALRNVTFSVEEGEFVAVMGESGSGKTTLLNILAALDTPTKGRVLLDGKDMTQIKEKDLAAFRRENLGFVFQDFNLLDTFSLKDNILLPLVLALVHSVVGMKAANDIIATAGRVDSAASSLVTAGVILVVYGGYFLATALACRRMAKNA